MAQKAMTGKVVSIKMQGSAVVEVSRKVPHKLYKKLMAKSKKYIVNTKGMEVVEGQSVSIAQTRKLAGRKSFTIVKEGENA